MSVTSHSPLSRLLALALLLGLVALLYLLLFMPLQYHYADNQRELEQLTQQLNDYQRIANSRKQIESLFESIRPEQSAVGYYLKGATQALASAELQAYARSIIEESGGNFVSTQPVVTAERDPGRLVKVSVRMRGGIESLLPVLYRIATGVPVLLIDEVLVRSEKSALSRDVGKQAENTLDVQFTLTGFVKESVL